MQPAFGISETRALHPVFQEVAAQVRHAILRTCSLTNRFAQLVTKWKEVITSDEHDMEQSSSEMNVAPWLSRATIDV